MAKRKIYRDARGRIVSREVWLYLQEEIKAQRAEIKERERRKALQGTPSKTFDNVQKSKPFRASRKVSKDPLTLGSLTTAALIYAGAIPTADLIKKIGGREIHYYRLESNDVLTQLIKNFRDLDAKVDTKLFTVAIGEGYKRDGEWIGSKWMNVHQALIYALSWFRRPSALDLDYEWFELMVMHGATSKTKRRVRSRNVGVGKSTVRRSRLGSSGRKTKTVHSRQKPNKSKKRVQSTSSRNVKNKRKRMVGAQRRKV